MIDSHAHVMFDGFFDREGAFVRAQEAGVNGWLEIGTDMAQSERAVKLASEHDTVWATVGVHPDDIAQLTSRDNDSAWSQLEHWVQQPRVVAVGEVGLDYYREGKLSEQLPVLEKFFALAKKYDKPVIFHVRSGQPDAGQQDAHADLISILQALPEGDRPRGVIHTFSGTPDQARAYLDLGLYLSFSGVITFKNAGSLIETVTHTPLDKILIETDCPFLAPEPYRGKQNEPAYVALIAQKVADIKALTLDQVDQQTEANTRQLFKLA